MMIISTFTSPAKVNLYLDVWSKRLDGYHNIESIVYITNYLYDTITAFIHIETKLAGVPCPDAIINLLLMDNIQISVEFDYSYLYTYDLYASLDTEANNKNRDGSQSNENEDNDDNKIDERNNTIYRAIQGYIKSLREYTRKYKSRFHESDLKERGTQEVATIKIRVMKRIPIGSGLGGGSSNAARILKFLNGLCGCILPDFLMNKIAIGIGADVLIFMDHCELSLSNKKRAIKPFDKLLYYVCGIGDIVCPINFDAINEILLKKGFDLNDLQIITSNQQNITSAAYKKLDLYNGRYSEFSRYREIDLNEIAQMILSQYNIFSRNSQASTDVEHLLTIHNNIHNNNAKYIGELSGSGSSIWFLPEKA